MVQSKTGGEINLADTVQGNIFSIPLNSTTKIKTYGFGIGADYRLPNNFSLSANLASDNLGDVPADLITNFNSPRFKFNASIANVGFGKDKRLGCNLSYRWQDKFYFEGDLANGYVEAVQTLDAQISYKLPVRKCMFKLGANNLLNQYYYNAVGNSRVGGLYYMSFGYNVY
jgi:outer membrane receptor protein involved in Fe transport